MSELGIEVAVDRPEVLADARAAFHRYEQALAEGDLAVLDELIWDDPRTVRYGVADRQRGADEIAAWRALHPSVPPGRRLYGTTVLTVDDRTAVVSTLFDYPGGVGSGPDPGPVEGRQTQTWVRFAEGWRIVAAHVSEVPTAAPSQTGPVRASPVQASPVQASPVQAGPVQASPVQTGPVQASPAQRNSVTS